MEDPSTEDSKDIEKNNDNGRECMGYPETPNQANPCQTSLLPALLNRSGKPVALEGSDPTLIVRMLSESYGPGNP